MDLLVAKSKKRAMEIGFASRYEFDSYWELCEGHWWYPLAQQEGMLKLDKQYSADKFVRLISREEAKQLLHRHTAKDALGIYLPNYILT